MRIRVAQIGRSFPSQAGGLPVVVVVTVIAALLGPSATPATAAATDSFGVSIKGLPADLAPLESFEKMVGRQVDIANYYVDFTTPDFQAGAATSITNQGSWPMITWEPMDSQLANPVDQSSYTLASIIAGKWDGLINAWATAIASWGHPVWLRFAHEMNGNWYPWCEGVNGNTAGQYVQAWQHVHDLFEADGATNVKWVWSPNVDYPGSTSLREVYPGDAYVDYVGIDGYNWGTSQSWSTWQTPGEVFNPTIADVRTFTKKPILLAEVSSAEQGGSKAQWIRHFFAWLKATPAVTGFVWFQFDKETDWRVQSSTASKTAFMAGLRTL